MYENMKVLIFWWSLNPIYYRSVKNSSHYPKKTQPNNLAFDFLVLFVCFLFHLSFLKIQTLYENAPSLFTIQFCKTKITKDLQNYLMKH